jgi:hypothetical protein
MKLSSLEVTRNPIAPALAGLHEKMSTAPKKQRQSVA